MYSTDCTQYIKEPAGPQITGSMPLIADVHCKRCERPTVQARRLSTRRDMRKPLTTDPDPCETRNVCSLEKLWFLHVPITSYLAS